MHDKKNIAAAAADFQANLTLELGATIQKSVLFFLDQEDDSRLLSPFEREMIAEEAWFHVVEKSSKYKPSKDAKFSTWAKKVARNFASDELDKLQNDPLHMTGLLHEDQPKNEDDAKKYSDTVSYRRSFGFVEDCSEQLDMRDALETLKSIVAQYVGRDRTVGEMLIDERTKEEIMAETQMSGGNVDTCKSRVLKKMRADMLKAGYSLAASASDAVQSAEADALADFFCPICKNRLFVSVKGSVTKTTIP